MQSAVLDTNSVLDWIPIMEQRLTEILLIKLESKFVGRAPPGPGVELLENYYNNLERFILAMEFIPGWDKNENAVSLGNNLLRDLKIQNMYCMNGTKRSDLINQLKTEANDPLQKANAVLMAKKKAITRNLTSSASTKGRKGGYVPFRRTFQRGQGNGRAGGQ